MIYQEIKSKKIKKNLMKISGLILLMILFIPSISAFQKTYNISVIPSYTFDNETELLYINAENHYQYGIEVGKRYQTLLSALKIISNPMTSEEEQENQDYLDNLDEDFEEEINGLAYSADVTPVEVIHLLNTFCQYIQAMNCTTSLSTGMATLYGTDTFLTQNLDYKTKNLLPEQLEYLSNNRFYAWWWINHPHVSKNANECYRYLFFGLPLFYEYRVVNEKMLCWGGNGLNENPDGEPFDAGLGRTTNALERHSILYFDNVDSVREYWNDSERQAKRQGGPVRDYIHLWDNAITEWSDKNGDILMIEQMHTYFAFREGRLHGSWINYLWHTNHHLWNDTFGPTGSIVPTQNDSTWQRANESYHYFHDNYGLITYQVIRDFTRHHQDDSNPYNGDICRHSDFDNESVTIGAWIIEPTKSLLHHTDGVNTPCQSEYYSIDLNEKFTDAQNQGNMQKYVSFNPSPYDYEVGSLPFLLKNSQMNNNFVTERSTKNENASLLLNSFISDLTTISNDLQADHEYTLTFNDLEKSKTNNLTITANGVINASLETDDVANNTWNSIQKAINNLSTLDILVIEKGIYRENVTINKSLIILGTNENDVIINGSLTMINPHDYILLNVTDPIMKVNMTGIQCLFHFDNTSDTGRESSGLPDIVHDYSPLEHDGTNDNATLVTTTIKGNDAFSFNGVNSSINLTGIPALSGNTTTISAWIYWNGSNHSINPILSQANQTKGYCLFIDGTTNTPMFQLGNHTLNSNITIDDGWHNIVGTYNGTVFRLYVDGVMTNSTSISDTGIDTTTFIGSDNMTHYFHGIIDEVAVWNRTLSSSEINHIYGLNYGVVLDGVTIVNSDIGMILVNHSDITNCRLINHSTGIMIDNLCDLKIQCNFTDCDTALNLTNSNPDDDNRIRLVDSTINQSTKGFHITSSSNLDLVRTYFNCTTSPLVFTQCNYSTINIRDTWAWGNSSPDQPSLSGPSLGTINTSYSFSSCTNDSDADWIFYQFNWGDGNTSGWLGPYMSNQTINATYSWPHHGGYHVQVQAKDIFYNTSSPSEDILFKTETLPPLIHAVQCDPMLIPTGWSTNITVNVSDDTSGNWSGISRVCMNITYPDQSCRNLTLSQITNDTYAFLFPETWLFGQYNFTIWVMDNAENSNSSSGYHFTVSHTLGDTSIGSSNASVENIICGSRFNLTEDALVHNITAYVRGVESPTFNTPTYQCMIYRASDGALMGSTASEEQTITGWHTFSFDPYPVLLNNTQYDLCVWGDNAFATVNCSFMNPGNGYSNSSYTFGTPPQTIEWNQTALTQYSIFCTYTTDIDPPVITALNATPDIVGFGGNITITANVTDNGSGIDFVIVRITAPDNQTENYTMTPVSGDTYGYLFSDTWQTGQYDFFVWAQDNDTNTNTSSVSHFHVSAEASMSIATLQDSYSGNQYINITDPPNPPENLTIVSRGLTWNTYYNASTGGNILETYQGPVNYQDESGSWTPINNTISPLSENHPAYVYGYRSGNNRGLYGVYFKSNAQQEWPVAFAYNKSDDPTVHTIRCKLIGVGYVDPQSNWAYQYLQNVQSSQGQTNDYSITFPGVFTGADVTWSYGNTGLKEEIILSNTTKTMLQNHPPSQYGLNDASSYLVFITKLDYQNLNLCNNSGVLDGNVTISDAGVDFKDVLGQFKCALPLGEAYELNNESVRQKLTYRIIHLNGNTYFLSGLNVSDLNAMTFPIVIDPTLTVNSLTNDGYIYHSNSNYYNAWTASTGTISDTATYLSIGQSKVASFPADYRVYRGFLPFNTSSLPSNAIIDNATLTVYKKDDYSTTDFDITIQNGQPTYPHNPLQAGDYGKGHYSGKGGSLNTSRFVNGQNNITLSNLDWINKTGLTKLCLRSSRDISGTTPTGSEYVNVYSTDALVQLYKPKLIIAYRNQSKIKNTGSTSIQGYLLIQVQYYDPGKGVAPRWVVDNDTVNETTPRTITSGNQLALDTIFNGHVRASDLTHGTGTYRVYTAFRDPDGNILRTNDDTELVAWWQFSKT